MLLKDWVSLEERKEALDAVKKPLFTLVKSVEKYLEDKDMFRLSRRMGWTLERLV
jgi:hypothetical protein